MSWPIVTLAEVGDFRAGFGFPNKFQGKLSGEFPFAKVGDISAVARKGEKYISTAGNYLDAIELKEVKAKPVPRGAIVFAKIGEAISQNFRAITAVEMLIDNNAMALVPDSEKVDTDYLYHFMCKLDLYRYAGATTVPSLRKSVLEGIEIPLPPLPEQKRIAAILDKADAIRRKRQQAIQLADDFLRAVFLDMFGDPVSNPKGWPLKPLGSLVINKDGKRRPIKASDRADIAGKYPYYGASGIIDYVNDFIFEGPHLLIGEDGANLLARSTPIAFIADGQYWVNNHAHVLGEKDGLSLDYLAFSINMRSLEPFVSGSAQPKLNQENLNKIPVQVPPADLIKNFLAAIKRHRIYMERVSESEPESLFSSLSQKAFSGQL